MPSLKWLRKKIVRQKKKGTAVVRDRSLLPLLPEERPYILTPSPSFEQLVSLDNYGLFQRLPYEIRRCILIEAFGGRTLHMDLEFHYPLVRKSGPQERIRHCDIGSNLNRDRDLSMGWQWFGCVCHRPVEWEKGNWHGSRNCGPINPEGFEIPKTRPCEDVCYRGIPNPDECGSDRGEDRSSRCFVGVMGWLLTCRQAYAEGIDILFGSNTFHLKSPDLLRHLPRMILPQRLCAIKSLEMCWLTRYDKSQVQVLWDDPTTEDSELHALCRMLSQAFPHVLHLDIAILSDIRPTLDDIAILRDISPAQDDIVILSDIGSTRDDIKHSVMSSASAMERIILGPMESILRSLGPGREFSIAVTMPAWGILAYKYRTLYGPKLKIELYDIGEGRFWKVLDPDNELGYWICCSDYATHPTN